MQELRLRIVEDYRLDDSSNEPGILRLARFVRRRFWCDCNSYGRFDDAPIATL
jgi:hypothetical protein